MNFKFLGITDDRTDCDLCGRANLKSAVALEDQGNGQVVFFGSDCAARALAWGNTKESRKAVKDAAQAATEALESRVRCAAAAHPNMVQVQAELAECCRQNVDFKDRPRTQWHQLSEQAWDEVLGGLKPAELQILVSRGWHVVSKFVKKQQEV